MNRMKPVLLIALLLTAFGSHKLEADRNVLNTRPLIVYFSALGNVGSIEGVDVTSSASISIQNDRPMGNTEVIAGIIKDKTNGDLYFLETEKKYSPTYNGRLGIAKQEQRDGYRPVIVSDEIDLDEYETIFLGYPIWWSDLPMAVYSFLESHDFEGKKVIPFITNGASGRGRSVDSIMKAARGAELGKSLVVNAGSIDRAEDKVLQWLEGLGY